MTTALSLITTAMVDAGAHAVGETIESADAAFALAKLNSMLDSWSTKRSMIYSIRQESANTVAGTASYTMGPAGTYSSTRPIKIVKAFIRVPTNMDIQLEIVDVETFDNIVLKSLAADYPRVLYNNAAFSSGLTTIKLWPVPQSVYPLLIDSYTALQSFATTATDLALPPGYQLAIESNLTLHLASSYGTTVTPEQRQMAKDSKADIKRFNMPVGILGLDIGVPGVATTRGDTILTGP